MDVFDCTLGPNAIRARELGARIRVDFQPSRNFEARLVCGSHRILLIGKGETAQAACNSLEQILINKKEYQEWLA